MSIPTPVPTIIVIHTPVPIIIVTPTPIPAIIVTPTPIPTPPTPVPGSTFNLILISSALPTGDTQRVNLSQGKYSINIHNINLTEVDMKVYENGVLQKRLSKDSEFSRKRNDVSFKLTVNMVTISFIPYGKRGAIGYVKIKRL
jgi:hypothetical protein